MNENEIYIGYILWCGGRFHFDLMLTSSICIGYSSCFFSHPLDKRKIPARFKASPLPCLVIERRLEVAPEVLTYAMVEPTLDLLILTSLLHPIWIR